MHWEQGTTKTSSGDIHFWYPHGRERAIQLHFAHATGFHARTYAPLFNALGSDVSIAAWDARGHGHSAAAGDLNRFRSWKSYAADLVSWLEQQPEPVWLAGHSVGGTVSAMVAAKHPELVRGLILIEPVLLSRRLGLKLRLGQLTRRAIHMPLAVGALNRRPLFPSLELAHRSYRGRGAFKTWPQEWLESYIEGAFETKEEGFRLRCAPEWEAKSFANTLANPWQLIAELKVPTYVHLGEVAQSTVNADARHTLQSLAPAAQIRVWDDATHFLPMERTAELAESMREFMLPD